MRIFRSVCTIAYLLPYLSRQFHTVEALSTKGFILQPVVLTGICSDDSHAL